jgi:predicted dehydrogenase
MDTLTASSANRHPLKIGIIGLGRSALTRHIPILKKMVDLFSVVAVCDITKERRTIVEKDFPNVRTYRQVEDMLDDQEIDIFDITLPTTDHVPVALAALARDRWTILETPIATSVDEANRLRAAALKTRGKLLVHFPEFFSPDFLLAKQVLRMQNNPLDEMYEIRLRNQDFIRRDDWQTVKRCGGGAVWYQGFISALQAYELLKPQPPSQLWSELKRVSSLGDAEDFAHIILKTRAAMTADIEINGGMLAPVEPSFSIYGSRGSFSVNANSKEGVFHIIDPAHKFPRRRSSVRMPPLEDMHENLPIVDIPVKLDDSTPVGDDAFWISLYNTVCSASPFPILLEECCEIIRYLQLVKQSSPFSN